MSNRVVGRPQKIYLQTPENGTLLLGLQGHEIYVLAEENALIPNCGEKDKVCPVSHLELRVLESENGLKGITQGDEELTSLSWLQNTNLLQNINIKASEQKKVFTEQKTTKPVEIVQDSDETESSWDGSNLSYSDVAPSQTKLLPKNVDETISKPPHSFSTLIFLAIESSPSKALPVRDIYSWITQHYPYYRIAPVGWKNSVRHNLSLNKCFYKVESGLNLSKGSYWMVDPVHRPQLIQSLCKVSYIKADLIQQLMKEAGSVDTGNIAMEALADRPKGILIQESSTVETINTTPPPSNVMRSSVNLPDPKLFPFLSRRLAFNTTEDPDVEVNAAKAMLSLGQSYPIISNSKSESDSTVSNEVSVSSQSSPVDDHTYSFIPRPTTKTVQRKLHLLGNLKRERSQDQKLAEHVPDMVRELEVSSAQQDRQSPKPAKLNRLRVKNGRGRSRGRIRGRGPGKFR